ncbi:hypothetical protein STEG23_032422 [Scotinomys teguina]
MRRKEKRLLQAVALALAALVLLPNVGLWALYRERQPDGSPGGSGVAVAPAAVQMQSPPAPLLNVSWPPGKRLASPTLPGPRACREHVKMALWETVFSTQSCWDSVDQFSDLDRVPVVAEHNPGRVCH